MERSDFNRKVYVKAVLIGGQCFKRRSFEITAVTFTVQVYKRDLTGYDSRTLERELR